MALPLQKYRELVFQMLYSQDIGKAQDSDIMELLGQELAIAKKPLRDAQMKVHLIQSHLAEIDALIGKASLSYDFERIQSVERNILRLGVFELFYDKEIPHKVVIAEALRLARKFSTKESASFVNAILDAIYRLSQGETIDRTQIEQSTQDLISIEKLSNEVALEEVALEKTTPASDGDE